LAGLGRRQGRSVRVCRAGNRHVRERGQVSRGPAGVGDEGTEVAEGSEDIRVEAGEFPERA
jgi:hypothetical protein